MRKIHELHPHVVKLLELIYAKTSDIDAVNRDLLFTLTGLISHPEVLESFSEIGEGDKGRGYLLEIDGQLMNEDGVTTQCALLYLGWEEEALESIAEKIVNPKREPIELINCRGKLAILLNQAIGQDKIRAWVTENGPRISSLNKKIYRKRTSRNPERLMTNLEQLLAISKGQSAKDLATGTIGVENISANLRYFCDKLTTLPKLKIIPPV